MIHLPTVLAKVATDTNYDSAASKLFYVVGVYIGLILIDDFDVEIVCLMVTCTVDCKATTSPPSPWTRSMDSH